MPPFGPEIVMRSPGRVNLIGEHTDYNDGFVLPAAIDIEMRLAFRARADGRVGLRSREMGEVVELERSMGGTLRDGERIRAGASPGATPAGVGVSWGSYVQGVYELMRPETGIEGEIASEIPVGSGLSSSAALELAVARALAAANGRDWRPVEAAKLCQQAEIEYAGNRCGIMDQLAVAMGKAGHALLIDCRSLDIEAVPLPDDVVIVVCDSAKPRQLSESAYNDLRAVCEQAAKQLGLVSLRDATPDMLDRLPAELQRRASHVVSENQRVLDFVAALRAGDRSRQGELMYASHASLRDLYQVSCSELDLLVELAANAPGCVGSRLTGAGFGGCTVSLVDASVAGDFAEQVMAAYRQRTGLPGKACACRAVDGVSLV